MTFSRNEDKYLDEVKEYIRSTYDSYYGNENDIQVTDIWEAAGIGPESCMSNVIKYAFRYGRKGNPDDWRKDLMKIIHYTVLWLNNHDHRHRQEESARANGLPSNQEESARANGLPSKFPWCDPFIDALIDPKFHEVYDRVKRSADEDTNTPILGIMARDRI